MLTLIKSNVLKQVYAACSAFETISESDLYPKLMLAIKSETPIVLPTGNELVGFTKGDSIDAIDSKGQRTNLMDMLEGPAFQPLIQLLDEMDLVWRENYNAESYVSRYFFHLNRTYEIDTIESVSSDYGFFHLSMGDDDATTGQAFIVLSCPAENMTYSFVLTSMEDGAYYYQLVYTE